MLVMTKCTENMQLCPPPLNLCVSVYVCTYHSYNYMYHIQLLNYSSFIFHTGESCCGCARGERVEVCVEEGDEVLCGDEPIAVRNLFTCSCTCCLREMEDE